MAIDDDGEYLGMAVGYRNIDTPIGEGAEEQLEQLLELAAKEVAVFVQEICQREHRIRAMSNELGNTYRYHNMIGKSKKMQEVYLALDKMAHANSSVFIQGENGTGKELVAKAIHYYSPRKDNVFLAVNCSAFNDNLLDSELFGHVKGAFTGAIRDKKGLFAQASGGTLFLDELGDTSPPMQVKLLRVLQEGTFLPVGSNTVQKCDVRIIASTNKPVKEMIEKEQFREDLYYRINVINITLPPLRERREDIALLLEYFMKKCCDKSGIPLKPSTGMHWKNSSTTLGLEMCESWKMKWSDWWFYPKGKSTFPKSDSTLAF